MRAFLKTLQTFKIRDDEGCILANDYQDVDKIEFILEAVRKMKEIKNV